jgi:hypothetical protein
VTKNRTGFAARVESSPPPRKRTPPDENACHQQRRVSGFGQEQQRVINQERVQRDEHRAEHGGTPAERFFNQVVNRHDEQAARDERDDATRNLYVAVEHERD